MQLDGMFITGLRMVAIHVLCDQVERGDSFFNFH
jgi:hypothetical protein